MHTVTPQTEQRPRLTVRLEGLAPDGTTTATHDDGRPIFVHFGIPGEVVEVEITRDRSDGLWGRVIEVIDADPDRVVAPCPYFGPCGGCQWQHVRYERQLAYKREFVLEQLRREGGFERPPVAETVAAPEQYEYRNHGRFTAGKRGELGYITRPGSGFRFLRVEQCLIMHPRINEILARFQGRAHVKHQVAVRYGINTEDWLVQPDMSHIDTEIETGQKHFYEALRGHRFRVSAPSFFQVNTRQAERLAGLVIERVAATGDEVVVDAYAGVGTFAVMLAPHVRRVIAIEESASAAADAAENIAGFANVEYYTAKVEHVLPTLGLTPDVLILDPSRAGCHPAALEGALTHRPRRIVYVSCNPATLARDLRVLVDNGYSLREVVPVDMFPQTAHVECVSTLELA